MALPAWLEWSASVAEIVGGLATAGGVVVAARELSAWRVQRKHDSRTAAAARIAEALLRAADSMELLRFRVELESEAFLLAVEPGEHPDRLLRRSVEAREALRQHTLHSTDSRELSTARADATIYFPDADEIVTQGERTYAVLSMDIHDLVNALDGGSPDEAFREVLARLKGGRFEQIRKFRTTIASRLGPLARHEVATSKQK